MGNDGRVPLTVMRYTETGFPDLPRLPAGFFPDGNEIEFRGHHVIIQDVLSKRSPFVKALQDKNIWDILKFSDNGVALPYNVDALPSSATHRGGHSAYNRFVITVINAFDDKYQHDNCGGLDEDRWLQESAKTIRGLVAFLRSSLQDPKSDVALHSRDLPGDTKSAPFWDAMTAQFDKVNCCFKPESQIAKDPFFQLGFHQPRLVLEMTGTDYLTLNAELSARASKDSPAAQAQREVAAAPVIYLNAPEKMAADMAQCRARIEKIIAGEQSWETLGAVPTLFEAPPEQPLWGMKSWENAPRQVVGVTMELATEKSSPDSLSTAPGGDGPELDD